MKKRINKIILLLSAATLLITGCTKTEDENNCIPCGATQVEFVISGSEFTLTESRAVDENTLSNITLWLFEGDELEYTFKPTGWQFIRDLTPGTYTLYAVGNTNLSLPQYITISYLESQVFNFNPASFRDGASIPMSRKMTVEIMAGKINRINVDMVRLLSKIDLDMKSAKGFYMKILSVQLCSASQSMGLFGPADPVSYENYDTVDCVEETYIFSSTYYIPENLRGENPAITHQREKSPQNAPAGATYLKIRGVQYGDHWKKEPISIVEHYVYLGGNNTTNFDITRNTHYTVEVTFMGIDQIDTRISVSTISCFGAFNYSVNTSMIASRSFSMRNTYTAPVDAPNMKVHYEVVPHQVEYVTIDGAPAVAFTQMALTKGTVHSNVFMYSPPELVEGLIVLDFIVVFTDDLGREFRKRMNVVYIGEMTVALSHHRTPPSMEKDGYISVLTSQPHALKGNWYEYVIYGRSDVGLKATPYEGYRFQGWYNAPEEERTEANLLSDEITWTYTGRAPLVKVWAQFEQIPVTVTYDANGGTGGMTLDDLYWNTHTVHTLSEVEGEAPAGFAFAGWNTQTDGKGENYTFGTEIQLRGDVTLYAQWVSL